MKITSPPPETLVNISLPDDGDELTQQSELFEQVCNERMQMRSKSDNLNEEDVTEGNETWMLNERRHSRYVLTAAFHFCIILLEVSLFPPIFSENASTVRQNSSSDEEETLADAGNDSMDIDNLDRKCI